MASLSQQDVVNKSESTEAQPVDIPANNDTFPVPRGTSDNAFLSQAAPGFTDDNPQSSTENELVPRKDISSLVLKGTDASLADDGNGRDLDQAQDGQTSNDVDSNQATIELPDSDNFEVGSVRSAGFDGSLGSDTDTTKLETTGAGKDVVPKYSVKKPAGFKPLSATKSFLAKAGTAVLPIKTAGDKGVASPSSPAPGSATSTTRPRLVAKTLSSSRTATPKSLNSGLQKAGGDGPDPNQVWNRNRVQMAPQATPKHMTDEELRQQYGIQLASRPLEGVDSSQAKWADLEDEDEDWAPETLEWSDGTKINLAQSDPPPPAIPSVQKGIDKDVDNPEKAAAANRPSLGPKATVLKLGGTVNQPKSLTLTPGIQSSIKNPNEKLTLVAKASPILPSKSPWAQLPPVEKIPPVAPPIQQLNARVPPREGYSRDAGAPNGSQATREIAADDYSRFSANAAPRELFNSQNGRYEPAPENRRGSMKREAGFRAPSVLQRPSQTDIHGSSEQSPMFQGRSTQDAAAWRRRRTSSNVSNDNGGRRMSMSRPGLDNPGRRDSIQDQSNGTGHGSYPENSVGSPAISHGFSHASQQSPVVENVSMAPSIDHHVVAQTPNISNLELEVAQQKKLMRERAEAAMKRRKEEEAKEEAEKRERLRLKLQALEPKEAPTAVPASSLSSAQPNGTDTVKDSPELQKPALPPKPPAPSSNGEPQQYGLIKMHASNQTLTNVGNDGKLLQSVSPLDSTGGSSRGTERFHDQDLKEQPQIQTANENDMPPKPISASINHQFEKDNILPPIHRMLGQPGSAGFQGSSWNQGNLSNQSSSVNVWAAPGSQKALGNGDFQKNITQIHLPPVSSQQYPQHLASSHIQSQPQPIGTPRQAIHSQTSLPPTVKEHLPLSQHYSAEHAPQAGHQRPHAPLPTAPKDVQSPIHMQNNPNSRPTGVAAWGDFARNASSYDAQKRAQLAQEHAALLAERERSGKPNNQAPILRETWTQVAVSDESGVRQAINATIPQREPGLVDDTGLASAQHHPIRSRYQDFFNRDDKSNLDILRPQYPLTPPPEEDDHPVFIGGAQRPKVRLPGSISHGYPDRPTPIVRLPVSDVYNKHPVLVASLQASRVPLAPTKHQSLVDSSAWQRRFNGLFGNDAIAHKRLPEVPGFSTSKEPLEQHRIPRTPVSLPPAEVEIVKELPMKSVEEEVALLEEGRDFGSKPPVNIPAQAPIQGPFKQWAHQRPQKDDKRTHLAKLKDTGIYGVAVSLPVEFFSNEVTSLTVKLSTMETEKVVPFTPASAIRQHRPSSNVNRGNKQRNTSKQHQSGSKNKTSQTPADSSALTTTHPNARPTARGGGFRKVSGHGHGNNWADSAKRTAPVPAAVR